MAFASKSEQRAALSSNYGSGTNTLQSNSVKGPKNTMGNNGPNRIIGKISSGGNKDGLGKDGRLPGMVHDGVKTGVAGNMSAGGYTNGPKWSRAMEPGELKPGTKAQAKNTTRINPDEGTVHATPKYTGTMPKSLRGGK